MSVKIELFEGGQGDYLLEVTEVETDTKFHVRTPPDPKMVDLLRMFQQAEVVTAAVIRREHSDG